MAERNYIDIEGMQKRVDEKDRKQSEEFRASLQAQTDQTIEEQNKMQELFAKAVQSEHDEAEKKRAAEIEAEKSKAVADVEAKYENKGVISEATKKRDEAYRKMLKNL